MIIDINPVAFYLPIPFVGWWPIYWYGISWVIAILSIHWFAKRNIATNANFTEEHVEDFLFYGVLLAQEWFNRIIAHYRVSAKELTSIPGQVIAPIDLFS